MIDNDGSFQYSKIFEVKAKLSMGLELCQNYPNPFNPSTRINYKIPYDSDVLIEVFNVLGMRVSQLVNEFQEAGYYHVDFNPSRENKAISSGVYYYKITAVEKRTGVRFNLLKKMVFLK